MNTYFVVLAAIVAVTLALVIGINACAPAPGTEYYADSANESLEGGRLIEVGRTSNNLVLYAFITKSGSSVCYISVVEDSMRVSPESVRMDCD